MVANNNSLPPAGLPAGSRSGRRPTLLPNFDKPVVGANGAGGNQSPADFLAANPRVDATATATIVETITTGDEITLEIANQLLLGPTYNGLGFISKTYTALSTDTDTSVAEALADLFNDDVFAQQLDLRADVTGAVITFRQPGPIGNLSTLSEPLSEPSKIVVGGTALTGDVFNVLFNGPVFGPVAPAVCLAEIGGVIVPTDTVALTFTNTSVASLPVTKTYTVVAGDTYNSIAAGLAALINADATLGAAGIQAQAAGNGLEFFHQGAVGNSTVVSRTVSGTETVTFDPSNGHMAGGTGQPGGVLVQYATTTSQNATQMGDGLAAAINANAALAAAGITASDSSGTITLTVPAAAEPLTTQVWVNTIAPVATITGSVAAGDVLNLVFTAAYLPGGAHTVSHTALLGETTTTLAAALSAAINADPVMVAAGITATPSTNHVDISYQAALGQIRFSQSVSPGSETIAWTTAPTETIVLSSKASELAVIASGSTGVTSASVTALLGGSETDADVVSLVFTNAGVAGFPVTISHTTSGGESLASIATALNTAINANATLAAAGVTSTVASQTLTIKQVGAIGNSTVVSYTQGGNSETVTFTPSNGHMAGGTGSVGGSAPLTGGSGPILVTNNFDFAYNGQAQSFFYGTPYVVDYQYLLALVNSQEPIV